MLYPNAPQQRARDLKALAAYFKPGSAVELSSALQDRLEAPVIEDVTHAEMIQQIRGAVDSLERHCRERDEHGQ